MTWHCNWSEDCDWFAERIETVLGTKCLSVVVLALVLVLVLVRSLDTLVSLHMCFVLPTGCWERFWDD